MTDSSFPPIADLVPETRPLPVPAVRRPAARPRGAPPGNLNALKHGRHSRFRDLLPAEPVSSGAARRLLSREQRIAERHAANLLALARLARYEGDCAAAIAEGRPLPPQPLITYRDLDLAALRRLLAGITEHANRERLRAAGLLSPTDEPVVKERAFIRQVNSLLPVIFGALDRSAAAAWTEESLTALLAPITPPDGGQNNQPAALPAEPAASKQLARSDSPRGPEKKTRTIPRHPSRRDGGRLTHVPSSHPGTGGANP